MRPLAPILALVSMLPLASCSSNRPNGNDGVLWIFRGDNDVGPMSRYLEQSFVIPSKRAVGGGLWPRETWTYDFTGTTLEASGAGIESPTTWLDEEGAYHVRFRCLTPSGQPTPMSLRIMDGAKARYADAFDVICWEPETLTTVVPYGLLEGQRDPAALVLGGEFQLHATVFGQVNGTFWTLSGTGIELADAGPMSMVSRESSYGTGGDNIVLRGERLGSNPALGVGPLQKVIPIEVVPDEAWTLKLWAEHGHYDYNATTLYFAGYPELADGGMGIGLRGACTFHFASDAGILLSDRQECEGSALNWQSSGTICVDAFGRSACGAW